MCGGRRAIAVRAALGVSLLRTSIRTSGNPGSRRSSSSSGARRFFCTSLPSARSGETYSTWVSSGNDRPWRSSPSIAHRNAARVLPLPVGAEIRVWWPSRMRAQPSTCGGEGVPIRCSNQRRTVGWKCSRGMRDRADGIEWTWRPWANRQYSAAVQRRGRQARIVGAMARLLVLGSMSFDVNWIGTRSLRKLGGVVTHAGVPPRRLGFQGGVVNSLGWDDHHALDRLGRDGVVFHARIGAASTRFVNSFQGNRRVQRLDSVADPIRARDLPEIAGSTVLLGALHPGDIAADVLDRLESFEGPVVADLQGWGRRVEGREVLPGAAREAAAVAARQVEGRWLEETLLALETPA